MATIVVDDPRTALDAVLEAFDNADTAEECAAAQNSENTNNTNNAENVENTTNRNGGSDADKEAEMHYEKISKMYIKEETRSSYNSSNCTLLLWLDHKHLECVSDFAKKVLQETFLSRRGATAKHLNMAVIEKALELVSTANDEASSPIVFSTVTARIFVDFLYYRARMKNCEFLS